MNDKKQPLASRTTCFFALIGWLCLSSAAAAVAAAGSVIHAGQLLSVPGEPPARTQTLVIEQGRIRAIEAGYRTPAQLGLAQDTAVIDLREAFVMPGFIDLHVHISTQYGPGSKYLRVTDSDADTALSAAM